MFSYSQFNQLQYLVFVYVAEVYEFHKKLLHMPRTYDIIIMSKDKRQTKLHWEHVTLYCINSDQYKPCVYLENEIQSF